MAVRLTAWALLLPAFFSCSSPKSKTASTASTARPYPKLKVGTPVKRSLRGNQFALVHATVVDVKSGTKLPDRAVIVEGDTIIAVVPSDTVTAATPTSLIDARGKYVIPGLWDMHVHMNNAAPGKLFVANGVTGVRIMSGHVKHKGERATDFELRDRYARRKGVGPRMVIGSVIFDGPQPIWPGTVALSTPDQARRAVYDAKQEGVDFIKVYTLLPRAVYYAIADESKKRHLPFAGHVPDSVTVAEASDAGQKSIEHLTGVALACSSREAELKRRLADSKKESSSPEGKKLRHGITQDTIASYDRTKAHALFAKFVANQTWHCPTFSIFHALSTMEDPAHERDARLAYVSPGARQRWNPKSDFRTRNHTHDDYVAQQSIFKNRFSIVKEMHQAGVPLLAGTDESNPYVFAGFSLHDELVWMVRAGLPPMDALRSATSNPARFFGWESKMGTVEAGKVADLVVLDADPTADIANTRKIFAVVARGVLHKKRDLDRLLGEARDEASRAR